MSGRATERTPLAVNLKTPLSRNTDDDDDIPDEPHHSAPKNLNIDAEREIVAGVRVKILHVSVISQLQLAPNPLTCVLDVGCPSSLVAV